jgi:hypothetical protein
MIIVNYVLEMISKEASLVIPKNTFYRNTCLEELSYERIEVSTAWH